MATSLLEGVRVVDLAGQPAAAAGRVLADLGADVVLVEPPEGVPLRRAPPPLGRVGRGQAQRGGRRPRRPRARRAARRRRHRDRHARRSRIVDRSIPRARRRRCGCSITPFGPTARAPRWRASRPRRDGGERQHVRDRRPRPRAGARAPSRRATRTPGARPRSPRSPRYGRAGDRHARRPLDAGGRARREHGDARRGSRRHRLARAAASARTSAARARSGRRVDGFVSFGCAAARPGSRPGPSSPS